LTIDVVDTLAEGPILELLAESETDPACNRRRVFLNEPGDLRGTNPMKVAHFPDGRNELCRLERIVEDELSACYATIDVVGGFWDE